MEKARPLRSGLFVFELVVFGGLKRLGQRLSRGGKRTFGSLLLWAMLDARQYNIRDNEGQYLCPSCGFPGYFEGRSYDEHGGVIGTGICPCCGWEPGFDDDPAASGAPATILESLRHYRRGHSSFGPAWAGRSEDIPAGWDGRAQIQHLFEVAPHVR